MDFIYLSSIPQLDSRAHYQEQDTKYSNTSPIQNTTTYKANQIANIIYQPSKLFTFIDPYLNEINSIHDEYFYEIACASIHHKPTTVSTTNKVFTNSEVKKEITPKYIRKRRKQNICKVSEEEIIKFVTEKGHLYTLSKIAKLLKTNRNKISKVIKDNNIAYTSKFPQRKRKFVDINPTAFEEFISRSNNISYKEIRKEFKCTRSNLNKFLSQHNINTKEINTKLPKLCYSKTKLNKKIYIAIIKLKDTHTMKEIGEMFNVDRRQISNIIKKKNITWGDKRNIS